MAWPRSVRRDGLRLGRGQFDVYAHSVVGDRAVLSRAVKRDPRLAKDAAATASSDAQEVLGAVVHGSRCPV